MNVELELARSLDSADIHSASRRLLFDSWISCDGKIGNGSLPLHVAAMIVGTIHWDAKLVMRAELNVERPFRNSVPRTPE